MGGGTRCHRTGRMGASCRIFGIVAFLGCGKKLRNECETLVCACWLVCFQLWRWALKRSSPDMNSVLTEVSWQRLGGCAHFEVGGSLGLHLVFAHPDETEMISFIRGLIGRMPSGKFLLPYGWNDSMQSKDALGSHSKRNWSDFPWLWQVTSVPFAPCVFC